MKYLLGGVILLVVASPAMACLNDTDVVRSEEQFRSGYQRSVDQPRTWRNFFGIDLLGMSAMGAGVGMIGLACFRAARAQV